MTQSDITVPTISCDHCKGTIEGAIGQLEGVESVVVDVARKDVSVRFDGAVLDCRAIVAAIEGVGYAVSEPGRRPSSGGCCG